MKLTTKILALSALLLGFASCEKHDFFDEDTITGAVGPEAYWVIESSAVKAGQTMGFTAQYYSSVKELSHSEVWYDINQQVYKMVSCPLVKSFTYSYTSNVAEQKRVAQRIASYPHLQEYWSDSLHAYTFTDAFPVSGTLAMVSWSKPTDTIGFTKNMNAYFGESFPQDFKDGLKEKMTYASYMDVFKGLSLMDSAYIQWVTDSTFDENSATWKKHWKETDSIWSTTNFDTLGTYIDTTFEAKYNRKTKQWDTTWIYTEKFIVEPWLDSTKYVYDEIMDTVNKLWDNNVTFYDLILGADGYAIEYEQSYSINAELRVYDVDSTYSKTDSKEITIN